MDPIAAREGPSSFGVHQYLPYLAHQDGYQRLRATFGSEIPKYDNNQSMTKMARINSLPRASPSHKKRRVTGRQRRTPKNGVSSTKSLGTTPMNVTQNSHWWPRSKTRSQTLIQNLILKIMVKERSSTQTPLLFS
jgi:hypothetical protein